MSSETVVVEQAADDQGDKRSPLRKTVGDIIRSMGIVAGIIALVLIVTWRPQPDPVREIDALPVAAATAAAADFEVLYPRVPPGWRSTSARFEPTRESGDDPVWFNGWVTPDGEFAAVAQSKAGNARFIDEQTNSGADAGQVAGGPAVEGWSAYISSDGTQRSFVRRSGGVTTVVTGTLGWAELAGYAAMLAPVEPAGTS